MVKMWFNTTNKKHTCVTLINKKWNFHVTVARWKLAISSWKRCTSNDNWETRGIEFRLTTSYSKKYTLGYIQHHKYWINTLRYCNKIYIYIYIYVNHWRKNIYQTVCIQRLLSHSEHVVDGRSSKSPITQNTMRKVK